jgi:hypothetical protein
MCCAVHSPYNVRVILHWDTPCSPLAVQRKLEVALGLAKLATKSYQNGLHAYAGLLNAAAERSYRSILAAICELSDEEADLIEPMLTDLEAELCLFRCSTVSDHWASSCRSSFN